MNLHFDLRSINDYLPNSHSPIFSLEIAPLKMEIQQMSRVLSLTDLPRETLFRIFQFLTGKTLLRVCCVCKLFNQIGSDDAYVVERTATKLKLKLKLHLSVFHLLHLLSLSCCNESDYGAIYSKKWAFIHPIPLNL